MIPLKSYRSQKTIVKKSPIDGHGLFAKEKINKGEIICIKAGHIIDNQTLEKYRDIIRGAELQIYDNFYLAPLTNQEREDTMVFLNHSCNPNVGPLSDIVWVAFKDISVDEELTIDYAMHISEKGYKLICNCTLPNCRKIITGEDWMKKDLQKKYGDYFSPYLLEKIKGNNK
jgi:uncharacterized protein